MKRISITCILLMILISTTNSVISTDVHNSEINNLNGTDIGIIKIAFGCDIDGYTTLGLQNFGNDLHDIKISFKMTRLFPFFRLVPMKIESDTETVDNFYEGQIYLISAEGIPLSTDFICGNFHFLLVSLYINDETQRYLVTPRSIIEF